MGIHLKDIRENWMIIVAFAAGACVWGATEVRLSYASEQTAANTKDLSAVKDDISKIRESAAAVAAAAEAQKMASAEAQRVTERQIDQIIQQLQRIQR